jgi:hypothetical protein
MMMKKKHIICLAVIDLYLCLSEFCRNEKKSMWVVVFLLCYVFVSFFGIKNSELNHRIYIITKDAHQY